ncbi:Uncharacterized protein RNJ44_00474 [Nakaseomyces bracarensis]|uniref:Skg3/CAF120-like PH-like domain-containing protein n=1 Tax=Nakaseomyces bracarensis TaxID=273131 RepID=A0ABR4NSU3_9SACH
MKFSLNSFKKSSSNTELSSPSPSEEVASQGPPSRKLSERLSFPSTSELGTQLKNRRKSSHHQMDLDFMKIPPKALEALKPLTALLASQETKRYFYWEFNPNVQDHWSVITSDSTESVASVEIKGTSFIIETQETSRILDVDLTGGVTLRVESDGNESQLLFNNGEVILSTKSEHSINILYRTALLSIFERFSILKALTGALIAQIGLRMSDINLVLNSHFSFKDWCDVYLEEQGGWVRLWCHVDGVEKKNKQPSTPNGSEKKKSSRNVFGKSNGSADSTQPSKSSKKGGYKIKFYRDNKSANSKNMVCFISSESNDIQDLFFYGTNENNRLGTNDNGESFLDNNLNMIKIIGDISFSNSIGSPNTENSASFSKSGSSGFLNGQLRNISKSSRNLSVSSEASSNDETQLTSPKTRGGFFSSPKLGGPGSPITGHKRSTSIASKKSSKSIPQNFTSSQRSLLIRPVEHEGVKQLETLIRFIVPLMDCLGKYGRPNHFSTNKNDPTSLMFGLPRLPIIDYFARKETKELLQMGPKDKSLMLESDTAAVAMKWLTAELNDYTRKVPDRDTKLAFTKITDNYPTVTTQSRNASNIQLTQENEIQQQHSQEPMNDAYNDTYHETYNNYDQQVQDQMQAEAEQLQAGMDMDMGFDMDMAMITDSIRNTNV